MLRNAAFGFFAILMCKSAWSAPIFFTDRALFDAETGGGLAFESFELLAGQFAPTAVLDDFSATETNDGGNNVIGIGGFVSGAVTDGNNSLNYFDSTGNSILVLDGFAPGTTALGFDIAATGPTSIAIGGDVSSSIALAPRISSFWGVVTSTALQEITLSAEGSRFFVGLDSVSIGAAAQAVPAPATVSLLALGLLALARRKQINSGTPFLAS
ncbi:MAG: PEP-CTERM sorting domain-containing protein [Pseudomonadota bacterium]